MATPLPLWSVQLFALCLPWAEALVGLAVLFGVATRLALVVGVLELVLLTFGSTLRQDWDAAGIQLSYALVYAVLLAALEYNVYSIDARLGPKSSADTSNPADSALKGEAASLGDDRDA